MSAATLSKTFPGFLPSSWLIFFLSCRRSRLPQRNHPGLLRPPKDAQQATASNPEPAPVWRRQKSRRDGGPQRLKPPGADQCLGLRCHSEQTSAASGRAEQSGSIRRCRQTTEQAAKARRPSEREVSREWGGGSSNVRVGWSRKYLLSSTEEWVLTSSRRSVSTLSGTCCIIWWSIPPKLEE